MADFQAAGKVPVANEMLNSKHSGCAMDGERAFRTSFEDRQIQETCCSLAGQCTSSLRGWWCECRKGKGGVLGGGNE